MVASTPRVPRVAHAVASPPTGPVRPGLIAELRHIQELLGHALAATTQIYTHVSVGHLKETLQRCHPRERASLKAEDDDGQPTGTESDHAGGSSG
jgi:hypothetical protein